MFKPEDLVTVTLQAQLWNEAMAILGRAKFNRVHYLISEIQKQCMAQQSNAPVPNSHDRQKEVTHVPH